MKPIGTLLILFAAGLSIQGAAAKTSDGRLLASVAPGSQAVGVATVGSRVAPIFTYSGDGCLDLPISYVEPASHVNPSAGVLGSVKVVQTVLSVQSARSARNADSAGSGADDDLIYVLKHSADGVNR